VILVGASAGAVRADETLYSEAVCAGGVKLALCPGRRAPEKVLDRRHDCPARGIRRSEDEIHRAWADQKATGQDLVDLQALLALNLRAAGVWEQLVGCAGGDPEKARDL
jgi:hypothetical protein